MNHHFRSQSERTGLLQTGQPSTNNNSLNVTMPDGTSNGFIRIHSDTQGSLDELFNPSATKAPPVPLRNRNLPFSFFNPSTAQSANVNHQPSFHARSTSFDHRVKPATVHSRTQSVLAPMTNQAVSDNSLCHVNESSSNSSNSINTMHKQQQQQQLQETQQPVMVQPQQQQTLVHQVPAQQLQPIQSNHSMQHQMKLEQPVSQQLIQQQQPILGQHQQVNHQQERQQYSHHHRNYSSPAFMQNELANVHLNPVQPAQANICHSRSVAQPIQHQHQTQSNETQHQHQHQLNNSHEQQSHEIQHHSHQVQLQEAQCHQNHGPHLIQHQSQSQSQFQHQTLSCDLQHQYQPQYQESYCQQVGTWLA